MSAILVPPLSDVLALTWSPENASLPQVPDGPFHQLVGLSRQEMKASLGLEAAEKRRLTKRFVATFQWQAVRPLLPLRLVLATLWGVSEV